MAPRCVCVGQLKELGHKQLLSTPTGPLSLSEQIHLEEEGLV